MGEIADAMLEGVLCAGCGEWMGGDGDGFPMYCGGCRPEYDDHASGVTLPDTRCPTCGKRCRGEQGLRDHTQAKHEKDSPNAE